MSEPTQLRAVAETNSEMSQPSETVARTVPEGAANADVTIIREHHRRDYSKFKRPLLFALLPVALVAGGYFYVTGGQIVSTDNAYLQANIVGVSTDVAGIVQSVEVHENEEVKAGQVLFRLKPEPFEIALAGARAKLEATRNQLLNLKASYREALAQTAQSEADIPYYQTTLDRQARLISTSAASHATYDDAKHDLDAALQTVAVAKAKAAATLAELGGDADRPVEQNPLYLEAKAAVDDAQRELDDATVRAPFDGVTANVSALQVGSYLQAAQAGFSLVSTKDMWIEANPKETELTYVRPGQSVTFSVDAYPGAEWTGKVASVSPASGASFALLPAQNSSGNWVKVVQRIPMRVSIDSTDGKPPLRVGMSTEVDIDTGHTRGLPEFVQNLIGQTSAYAHE